MSSQTANQTLQPTTQDPTQTLIVRVAVAVPLRCLFDYLMPADHPITPLPGMRVEVPFGKSSKIGLVDSVDTLASKNSELDLDKLKLIQRVLDDSPLLDQSLIRLYRWLKNYYHAPSGEIWQTMLPSALLKGKDTQLIRTSRWLATEQGLKALQDDTIKNSAIRQKLVLQHLQKHPEGIPHDRLKDYGFSYQTMKALAGKNWLTRDYNAPAATTAEAQTQLPRDIQLNSQQQAAIDTVAAKLDGYAAFLLFGVTASGKTEVYLRLIQQVIEQQKQALVLVPEIGLTPQTLKRFKQRFKVEIVMLHSGMSEQQRLQNWLKAKKGDARIIIGTRSALFVPLQAPGIIIIDEEHDRSFRQQQGFRYSARDVAMVRAHFENIPILLASASPSVETLMNVAKNKITRLDLTIKAKNSSPLDFHIIDLKNQPMNQGLSFDLITRIKQHLEQKGQILLFLNRRGYAPVLLCHECGWSARCSRCDIHYTYHHNSQYLQCHHCGSSRRSPHQCPECQCEQMLPIGLGTERLEEVVQRLFPQARCARIDRDTTRRKSAMSDFVSSVKAGEVDILIGTQMLAKGHHFPDISLVALIDMDGALYSADFRAPEYAAQLITQVSGRAGRADRPGEVIIQTHLADHPMLQQIIHQGYASFAESAIQERIEAELPPHAFSAVFQAESPKIDQVKIFLQETRQILDRYHNLKVELLGPAPAIYTKKAGKFRYQLYLQSDSRNQLHQLIELTIKDIEKLKSASRVRWRLEIDPLGEG